MIISKYTLYIIWHNTILPLKQSCLFLLGYISCEWLPPIVFVPPLITIDLQQLWFAIQWRSMIIKMFLPDHIETDMGDIFGGITMFHLILGHPTSLNIGGNVNKRNKKILGRTPTPLFPVQMPKSKHTLSFYSYLKSNDNCSLNIIRNPTK